MYILLIFIPFLTFLTFLMLGRKIGKEGAITITKVMNLIQIILINIIGYEIILNENKIIIQIFIGNWDKWIYTDIMNNIINIKYDLNSILLTELIIIIFTIVINYSIWYLNEDPYIIRFLSKLYLFCFMMLLLVLSNNYIIMLMGWEYVGLTSYLLINFWYTRMQANKSAIKAIVLNKIGDIGLILAILIIINNINNNLIKNLNCVYYINSKFSLFIFLFFILAAFAKSAQIFLHSWLKDAMEAPSPVSALLHAATMVTAGVYIIFKILPILPLAANISSDSFTSALTQLQKGYNIIYYISIICLLTIIIGGLSSLFQYDIKKIIAFSTMSQLGYMFIGNFIGCYNNSYNHLIIHGFFKALLFLSAGILIHSISNEQDIRKYGSLLFYFPYTYMYFIIGTLAIISWPLFSGFYSKDILLENTKLSYNLIYILALFGALITTIYSIKLIKIVFLSFGSSSLYFILKLFKSSNCNSALAQAQKEPKWNQFSYLNILVLGSLFLGYYLKDLILMPIVSDNFYPFFTIDYEYINILYKTLPIFIIITGIIIGYNINKKEIWIIKNKSFNSLLSLNLLRFNIKIDRILGSVIFFDYLYNRLVKIFFFFSYHNIYKLIDKGFLDLYSSLGLYRLFKFQTTVATLGFTKSNSSFISNYKIDLSLNFIYLSFFFLSLLLIYFL